MDTRNPAETSELDELIHKYSPFLNEIRRRVLFTVCIFIGAIVVGFAFYEQIIRLLIDLLGLQRINLVFTSPFQFINLAISCGIAAGLVLIFPLILYQILSFLKPALKRHEYKMVLRLLPFPIILFLAGFSFGFLIMKWQIVVFLEKSEALGIGNVLDISKLLSTVLLVSAIMGVASEFPIVIFILMRLGIIQRAHLSRHRLWVYLGALLFAILLPLDSVLADFLLVLPLIALFELTVLLIRILERKSAKPLEKSR